MICFCFFKERKTGWLLIFLDLSQVPFVISCSPGLAACQKLWSIPYGFRFHPVGAVTKINDLIFVVLAGWQQLHPGWLTLSAVCHSWRSPLPISKIALILRSLPPCRPPSSSLTTGQGGRILGAGGMVFIPHGWERAKQWANVLREFLAFSCSVPVAWFGVGFLGEREEEPGESAADSAADTSSDLYLFLQP